MADSTSTPAVAPAAPATTTPVSSPCGAFGSPAPSGDAGTGTPEGGQGAAPTQNMMGMLTPIVIFVLIFYFFIIRPQRKKQKQHDTLLSSINRGDQVITIGGFLGTVREVRDDSFTIELAEGVKVRILKSAIQTKRLPSAATEEKKD